MGRPNKYPDQFRKDALELVRTSQRPTAEVARSLGIAEGTLWNWVRAERDASIRAADPECPTCTAATGPLSHGHRRPLLGRNRASECAARLKPTKSAEARGRSRRSADTPITTAERASPTNSANQTTIGESEL
jgi:transposase-like protein